MPYNRYIGITEERFNRLEDRYGKFVEILDSKTQDPIKVFDPLTAKQLKELQLIREVSTYLQRKKEEDMKKAQATETNVETYKKEIEDSNVIGTEKTPVAV